MRPSYLQAHSREQFSCCEGGSAAEEAGNGAACAHQGSAELPRASSEPPKLVQACRHI